MKMKMTAFLLALCLFLSFFVGCRKAEEAENAGESISEGTATENSADDREGRGRVILGIPYEMPVAVRLVDRYNLFSEDKVEIKVCDGKDKLNLAVLSGEVDMIACQEADTMTRYAVNGYLEPLENLIGGGFTPKSALKMWWSSARWRGIWSCCQAWSPSPGCICPKPSWRRRTAALPT